MLAFLALAAIGGNIMASTVALNGRADQIYGLGPEDLVAATPTIVAGPVSGYAKQVQKYSEPGPNGFPLEWVASGRIDQPKSIKGSVVSGPLPFSRPERSFFLPVDPEGPIWERDFGDISPNGQVVVFLNDGDPRRAGKTLPSGNQEQDLVELVRGIVEIQAIRDPTQQRQAWLRSLTGAHSDEARRVALRSLVRAGADWSQMAPALKTLFSEPALSNNIRAFAFGFVAFYIAEEKWPKENSAAIDLLCQAFSTQRESSLEIQYLQSFKLILRYTAEEPLNESRQPLRRRIMETLEQRAAHGVEDPTLREEYKRIRTQYGNRRGGG
jgi:hypothetical protein